MKTKLFIAITVLLLALMASAGTAGKGSDKDVATANASAIHPVQDDSMRLEGEKRFHSNCGRCHSAPPAFAPRMMATIVRHMRVRATITDDDMHLILHYMTR